MNNTKKSLTALLCIAMAGLVLSGCSMRSASGTTATAVPITTSSPMTTAQTATMTPMTSPDMETMGPAMGAAATAQDTTSNATAATPAQVSKLAEQIAEAVERISEIDDAEVVISDDWRALIAVEFDDQYKAGLDDRMEKLIIEAAHKVDDGLKEVEITDDGTLYGQVKGLGERLVKATGMDELANDFGDLWDRVTGM